MQNGVIEADGGGGGGGVWNLSRKYQACKSCAVTEEM